MRRRTSCHRLNADRALGTLGKAGYFLLNWINNQLPYSGLDRRLTIRDFVRQDFAARWPALPRGASPSRTVSDLFWLTLPWRAMHDELGAIRILDVGCGNGQYGPRLLASAEGHIERYTGADARQHESWAALAAGDARLRFFRSAAESFRGSIPAGTNLFISQSAIEHFDEDLVFFDQIRDYVRATEGPVLQIHLVPSQACLRLYHLHGARQYTPRTLSAVTRLFDSEGYAILYRLGGRACNQLHHEFITKPVLIRRGADLRQERPEEYDRRLFEAIAADMEHPDRSPAFWALVIHSRPKARLFE